MPVALASPKLRCWASHHRRRPLTSRPLAARVVATRGVAGSGSQVARKALRWVGVGSHGRRRRTEDVARDAENRRWNRRWRRVGTTGGFGSRGGADASGLVMIVPAAWCASGRPVPRSAPWMAASSRTSGSRSAMRSKTHRRGITGRALSVVGTPRPRRPLDKPGLKSRTRFPLHERCGERAPRQATPAILRVLGTLGR